MVSAGITADANVAVTVGVVCPSIPFLGADGSRDGKGGRPVVGGGAEGVGAEGVGYFGFLGVGCHGQLCSQI